MVLNVIKASAPKYTNLKKAAACAWIDFCAWSRDRRAHPYKAPRKNKLLTPPLANTKLAKGSGVPIYGLTLAPAGASGHQVCAWRSPECEAACLGITSGRSKFSNVLAARIAKTKFMMESPYHFFRMLYQELDRCNRKHGSNGFAFRSNVLSDIPWESVAPQIYKFSEFNYDYTKGYQRLKSLYPNVWLRDNPTRPMLDLTLSYSGCNQGICRETLANGGRIAVVFNVKRGQPLPEIYSGYKVVDGDESDRRFLDPANCIVGLRAKGKIDLKSDFVVTAGDARDDLFYKF
jgi:hypothetical protein